MKKLLSVVLACLIILLVGCSNEKAVKEAATSEFNNETSFSAGNTEAEKPQESDIVESSVQVMEKSVKTLKTPHRYKKSCKLLLRKVNRQSIKKNRLNTKSKKQNRNPKIEKTRLNRKQQPRKPCRKSQKKNLCKSQSQPKQQSLQKKHLM